MPRGDDWIDPDQEEDRHSRSRRPHVDHPPRLFLLPPMRDEIEIKINVHGGPLLPSLYFPISQQFKSVLYFLFPAAASVKKKTMLQLTYASPPQEDLGAHFAIFFDPINY
jgi:hypothetical protein